MFCWFFFFKQKTAYEMRISDWSSDVCSSDLLVQRHTDNQLEAQAPPGQDGPAGELGVGLHEALVEEDRREPRPRPHLVAEPEPQRGTHDAGDQLLALAPGPLPQRAIGPLQLTGDVIEPLGAALDLTTYVQQPNQPPPDPNGDRGGQRE